MYFVSIARSGCSDSLSRSSCRSFDWWGSCSLLGIRVGERSDFVRSIRSLAPLCCLLGFRVDERSESGRLFQSLSPRHHRLSCNGDQGFSGLVSDQVPVTRFDRSTVVVTMGFRVGEQSLPREMGIPRPRPARDRLK